MDHITTLKAALTAFFVALSAAIGWLGWLVVLLAACMFIDYLTGTAVASRRGEWSSQAARAGLWHKAGEIVAVLVALVADALIALVLANLPVIHLPFAYPLFFFPLVLVWYILTELGSIIENVGQLGAPVPGFLRRLVKILHTATESAGGQLTPEEKEVEGR